MRGLRWSREIFAIGDSRFGGLGLVVLLAAVSSGCAPSPHDVAGRKDSVEELKAMLTANPDAVSAVNDLGKTPLHYAVTYGREEAVELLLDQRADSNAQDRTGMTPMHCAATLNRVEEAALLLAGGAELERTDRYGDTALHSAAIHGKVDMIKWLVRNGANLAASNAEGKTPADLARRERKTAAAELLVNLAARAN